jgi:hypothetical protein
VDWTFYGEPHSYWASFSDVGVVMVIMCAFVVKLLHQVANDGPGVCQVGALGGVLIGLTGGKILPARGHRGGIKRLMWTVPGSSLF